MTLAEVSGFIGLLTAVSLFIWYLVQSRTLVKTREFQILRDTVDTLEGECKRLRTELQAAQQEIVVLRTENKVLRGRLAEFEVQNGKGVRG